MFFCLIFQSHSTFSQFIIHVQDWEGVSGSGNWIRNELPANKWTRGTDTNAVLNGSKATYISNDEANFGYDQATSSEAYAYKDIAFPSTGVFYVKFDWKCVGDVDGGVAYDYFRVFMVPTTTSLNETDLENEVNGFEILGPGTQNRFVEQSSFTMRNYPLTPGQNSTVRGNTYRLVLLWVNDDMLTDGVPAAVDNIIISDGDATAPLDGTYQIGKNSAGTQRFDSIMHATALLNINGVSGNINFELTDEDYTIKTGDLPLRIEDFNSNPNSTVSNAELVLQPLQNGSLTPTISGVKGGNSIFLIDRASNITINGDNGGTVSNDLSIENNSGTNPVGIQIGSDIGSTITNENITIENSNIDLSGTTGTGILISNYNDGTAPGSFNTVTISNNNFSGGEKAIYAIGDNGTANGSGLSIQNNSMDDNINPQGLTGIEINGTDNIDILHNIIGNINSSDNSNIQGIRLGANSSNVLIEKNEIYNLAHGNLYGANGISLASNTLNAGIQIRNNMIYNISADGWDYTATYFDNAIGIAVEGNQSGISILNNSIYLKEGGGNVLTANADSYTACLSIGTGATINTLKNNLLINTLGGDNSGAQPAGYTAIAYQGTFTDHFPDIDYNFYYSQAGSIAGGTESLASDFSSAASSLETLKTLSGADLSSIGASSGDIATFNGAGFTFDPERLFTAVSEGTGEYLAIDESQQEAWLMNAAGTHLVGMNEDFSGNSRNTDITAIPPSLGAFEFTANTQPVPAYQDGVIADAAITDFYVANRKIMSLTWDANGGSLPSALEVNYYPGNLPPGTGGYPVFNGYVQINATGGSGYEYDLELAYEPALLAGISTTDILLTKRSDGVNDWTSWPTAVNTVDRVFSVSNIDNGFSYFTGTDQNNPLPVELISFSAKTLLGEIQIQWETASEKNNDHFIVEKKGQDNTWVKISTVEGATNSNTLIQYSITDINPISGTQYYRLKQVDTDGKFEYSQALRVEYGVNRTEVFPNPFTDKIFVKTNGENSVERIELKNITGNAINITNEYLGQNNWEINTQSLETGTYILYVYMKNQVEVRKIVKR
ncbi:T9SS type A sorting domain-containing protein [Marivirga tractuosa]|uniref:T9SS type A sorting domain-containing protein n=1 Tax=Marivirga tractuosa TaxID=1006 RepID=UPI00161B5BE6|nr:T9SS type A sorting domain-containing protein [Marivirga tractuosa]